MTKQRPLLDLKPSLEPFRILEIRRIFKTGTTCRMLKCRERVNMAYEITFLQGDSKKLGYACEGCKDELLDYGDANAFEKTDQYRAGWEVACDCCGEAVGDDYELTTETLPIRQRAPHLDGQHKVIQSLCVCATCYEEVKNS